MHDDISVHTLTVAALYGLGERPTCVRKPHMGLKSRSSCKQTFSLAFAPVQQDSCKVVSLESSQASPLAAREHQMSGCIRNSGIV